MEIVTNDFSTLTVTFVTLSILDNSLVMVTAQPPHFSFLYKLRIAYYLFFSVHSK